MLRLAVITHGKHILDKSSDFMICGYFLHCCQGYENVLIRIKMWNLFWLCDSFECVRCWVVTAKWQSSMRFVYAPTLWFIDVRIYIEWDERRAERKRNMRRWLCKIWLKYKSLNIAPSKFDFFHSLQVEKNFLPETLNGRVKLTIVTVVICDDNLTFHHTMTAIKLLPLQKLSAFIDRARNQLSFNLCEIFSNDSNRKAGKKTSKYWSICFSIAHVRCYSQYTHSSGSSKRD